MKKPRESLESDPQSPANSNESWTHLTPLMYQQLRRLGQRYMQRERPGHTLQPTALVNEALTKLSVAAGLTDRGMSGGRYCDEKHFFAVCARQMRHILVDHAKARGREKRQYPGPDDNSDLDGLPITGGSFDVIEIDQLMRQLEEVEPDAAFALELFYFGGHTYPDIARITKVSEPTVKRQLRFARAWMLSKVQGL